MIVTQNINCFMIKTISSSTAILYICSDLSINIENMIAVKGNLYIDSLSFKLSKLDDVFEIKGCYDNFFSHKNFDNKDIIGARIDYFTFSLANYSKSPIIKRGFVSSFELNEFEFKLTLKPLTQYLLLHNINHIYSKTCRAKFADKRCGIDLRKLTKELGFEPKCNKTPEACKGYNNIINFRGE